MANGTCLCGATQYEISGPFNMMLHCHCSMCRKHHGSVFATFVSAPLSGFKWTSGKQNVAEYPSSAQGKRPFCRTCGSVAPTLAPSMGIVICPAGSIEGDLNTKPMLHMFAGSKAPWYTITDSLPQHESWPPDFGGTPVDTPPRLTKPDAVTGSCLCNDVAYEYTGKPMSMWNCHCSRCRRARSAAHATNVFVPLSQFRWTRGESQSASYKVPEARHFTAAFCTRCGGKVPYVSTARGIALIPAGSLDSDPGMRPLAHIYTSYKAPWFDITDSVLQYPEAPPAPNPSSNPSSAVNK